MIRLAWRGLWQRKVRTILTLIGVAACVLALTTMDGMAGYMQAERETEVTRMAERVLLQPHGAGYPPLKNTLRAEPVMAAIDQPGVIASESTPLLFLVLEPPNSPMDIASVIGVGLWPGHERAWLGAVGAAAGRATLRRKQPDH